MMWESAERVQKNEAGEYRALIGGEWVPVEKAQKNENGEFRVQRPEQPSKAKAYLDSLPPDRRKAAEAYMKGQGKKEAMRQEVEQAGAGWMFPVQFANNILATARGVKQMVPGLDDSMLGASGKEWDALRSTGREEYPLTSLAGDVGAEAAKMYALFRAAPGLRATAAANPYKFNTIYGTLSGALEAGTPEERLERGAWGGLGGFAGTGLAHGAQKVGSATWEGIKKAGRSLRNVFSETGPTKAAAKVAAETALRGANPKTVAGARTGAQNIEDVAQALERGSPGITAGRAAAPTGNAEFVALEDIARASRPSDYVSVDDALKAAQQRELAALAGGETQDIAMGAQKMAKDFVRQEVWPQMDRELAAAGTAGRMLPKLQGQADELGNVAANKVADVRRMNLLEEVARRRAQNQTPVPGMPRIPGRYSYADELAQRAAQTGEQSAETSLLFGQGRNFAQNQADSLAAHGLKPIDTSKITGTLEAMVNDPKIGTDKVNARILNNIRKQISDWTQKSGGIISPDALHGIRTNAINAEVMRFAGDPKSKAQYTAKVLGQVRPLIDDAIEAAGGTEWRNAIGAYERGMNQVSRQQMGARALGMLDKSPDELAALARGNRPDIVEDVFGPGKFSFAAEMGDQAAPIVNVGKQIELEALQKKLAEKGATEAKRIANTSIGAKSGLEAPGFISRATTIYNTFVRGLEGIGGEKANKELARLFLPENKAELANLIRSMKPSEKGRALAEATKLGVKFTGGELGLILGKQIPDEE